MSFTTAALLVTWAALLLVALALAGVVRQLRSLVAVRALGEAPLGPPPGQPAPRIDGMDFSARHREALLLFVERGCEPCERLLADHPALTAIGSDGALDLFAVLSQSPNGLDCDGLQVLADARTAFDAFQIPATPFAVLVGVDGIVKRSAPIASAQALRDFVTTSTEGMV